MTATTTFPRLKSAGVQGAKVVGREYSRRLATRGLALAFTAFTGRDPRRPARCCGSGNLEAAWACQPERLRHFQQVNLHTSEDVPPVKA